MKALSKKSLEGIALRRILAFAMEDNDLRAAILEDAGLEETVENYDFLNQILDDWYRRVARRT